MVSESRWSVAYSSLTHLVARPAIFYLDQTTECWNFKTFKKPRNRFQGIDTASLCSLSWNF
jgi:hypothetical protein